MALDTATMTAIVVVACISLVVYRVYWSPFRPYLKTKQPRRSNGEKTRPSAYILSNKVTHVRHLPASSKHSFTYPTISLLICLDALESGALDLPALRPRSTNWMTGCTHLLQTLLRGTLFSYGGLFFRLTGIRPDGYLMRGKGTIREKLERMLRERGVLHDADTRNGTSKFVDGIQETQPRVPTRDSQDIRKAANANMKNADLNTQTRLITKSPRTLGGVWMLTMPSFLGWEGINPLTVYFCYDMRGEFRVCVLEIHNTFGESHIHILQAGVHEDELPPSASSTKQCQWTFPRQFHVSPFNDREGWYRVRVDVPEGPPVPTSFTIRGGENVSTTNTGRTTQFEPPPVCFEDEGRALNPKPAVRVYLLEPAQRHSDAGILHDKPGQTPRPNIRKSSIGSGLTTDRSKSTPSSSPGYSEPTTSPSRSNLKLTALIIPVTSTPLTSRSLLRALTRQPWDLWSSMARIVWEAGVLHYGKRLAIRLRPSMRHFGARLVGTDSAVLDEGSVEATREADRHSEEQAKEKREKQGPPGHRDGGIRWIQAGWMERYARWRVERWLSGRERAQAECMRDDKSQLLEGDTGHEVVVRLVPGNVYEDVQEFHVRVGSGPRRTSPQIAPLSDTAPSPAAPLSSSSKLKQPTSTQTITPLPTKTLTISLLSPQFFTLLLRAPNARCAYLMGGDVAKEQEGAFGVSDWKVFEDLFSGPGFIEEKREEISLLQRFRWWAVPERVRELDRAQKAEGGVSMTPRGHFLDLGPPRVGSLKEDTTSFSYLKEKVKNLAIYIADFVVILLLVWMDVLERCIFWSVGVRVVE